MSRKFNFNAGPATLPLSVLQKVQEELLDYQGQGFSILESSHRSQSFETILNQAKEKILNLLKLDQTYSVLFLQGGASSDFFRIPMNLLTSEKKADYIETGTWAKKAFKEAQLFGDVKVAASSKDQNFNYIPKLTSSDFRSDAKYIYLCSNNTIVGTQYQDYPKSDGIPLVGDFTSDIFCRSFDSQKFGIIFAGAQKNLGPAGLSVVVIRKDLLEACNSGLPSMCHYPTMSEANSLYNTSPVFPIYFVDLVLDWIIENGGIEALEKINRAKAEQLYATIDELDFYQGTANKEDRSIMNVTWTLPSDELSQKFIKEAAAKDLHGLKGHRSVGGVRASIYNAFPQTGIDTLTDFMKSFAQNN